MSARTDETEVHPQTSNRLILCFDGTGNVFSGTPGDTNIVKLYNMFQRSNTNQMHYYQPGIGTYPAEGPVNVSWFRSLLRKFGAVIDQALATSFDSHVIAGYRFVMRYYRPGDRIYIFGFSRGAFTARFLSRMISHVGLLSVGNDELVPFAYKMYQDFEQTRGISPGQIPKENSTNPEHSKQEKFMASFKSHFCRTQDPSHLCDTQNTSGTNPSKPEAKDIKVHFLGLFDCVSSVGTLDIPFFQKITPSPIVSGTAEHVRHAVAIDERRVKFKAALFAQEKNDEHDDIKEVWFPGNHGDIGGGWDDPEKAKKNKLGEAHVDPTNDYFQLSDIALKWMVDEIDNVEKKYANLEHRLAWDKDMKKSFLDRFEMNKEDMIGARVHDTLTRDGGSKSKFTIALWNFMENLPFVIKRWEYVKKPRDPDEYVWDYIGWPLNRGGRRDIPPAALFHQSVISRMHLSADSETGRKLYAPNNDLWFQVAGAKRPIKTNLKYLVPSSAGGNDAISGDETHIQFAHVPKLTVHSIATDNETKTKTKTVKADKWDNINCVVSTH